jgi:hypothetical protein
MNRIQEVHKLYPKFANLAIEIAEPSHNNKYLKWIATQLSNKHTKEDIKATVTAFHRNCKRLRNSDIYQYTDLKELENEIKDLELSKRQIEIFSKDIGSVKIYSDDICTLIRINSKHAMLYYGKSSRWCVAMEKEDYWEDYSSFGNVFYILIDKNTNHKYAIQKRGIVEMTIWAANDKELDINNWIKSNKQFEPAIFACLHDQEDPMIYKIKTRQVNSEEFNNWIKFQHYSTINFLITKNISGYYLFDINNPTSKESLNQLGLLNIKDLLALKEAHPECIDNIVNFLSTNSKIKLLSLRKKLGNIISNPELILKEEDANIIKMKRDSSIALKLLKSNHKNVWTKALAIANAEDIISVLQSVNVNKQNSFIQQLKKRTHYNKLIKWLSQTNMPKIPSEVWLTKQQSNINEYADDDDDDDDDYEENDYDE